MFTFSANAVLWTMLGLLLTATIVVRNMYCRFLCPLGATLGVISQVSTLLPDQAVVGVQELQDLRGRPASGGAIEGPKIIKSECVRCDDCERIYLDQQKWRMHLNLFPRVFTRLHRN